MRLPACPQLLLLHHPPPHFPRASGRCTVYTRSEGMPELGSCSRQCYQRYGTLLLFVRVVGRDIPAGNLAALRRLGSSSLLYILYTGSLATGLKGVRGGVSRERERRGGGGGGENAGSGRSTYCQRTIPFDCIRFHSTVGCREHNREAFPPATRSLLLHVHRGLKGENTGDVREEIGRK